MNFLLEELAAGFPDAREMTVVTLRLVVSLILASVIGFQRERMRKSAGLRTHMLVSLGAAVFVIACTQLGMNLDSVSRVIQGLITGIGFIGAGAILKLYDRREVEGLTTAAGIWMTAAIGVTVGLGRFGLALIGTMLAWITLSLIRNLEELFKRSPGRIGEDRRAHRKSNES